MKRASTPGARWRCMWRACPDRGHVFTAPAGISALADVQRHHATVHGVPAVRIAR